MATNNHSERAHALLSASSAHRWLACPPSAVVAAMYPNTGNEFTREGTLAHEVAEIVANGFLTGEPYKIEKKGVTTEMIDCALDYRAYIREQIKSDDAVVLLERRVDFSPWVPKGFGTCDCIILQGDTLIVIDYKYGVGVPVEAKGNPQMRLYALGALNDYGFAYDIAKVETHVFQPRIDNISADTLTVEELTAWGEEIVKPTAAVAAEGKGEYSAGAHCKFCPHAGKCPTLTKVCSQYVRTHGLRAKVPVMAPHEIAEVLSMEPLVSLWLKRVREQALSTLMEGGEVPGYKVVAGRGSREWADEVKVLEAMKAAGHSPESCVCTEILSPAQMEKVHGKKHVAEVLGDLIESKTGSPTIAPETDKRPPYDRMAEARKDFDE